MPRTWLITGCSSGFGRELALAAGRNHDTVIATSRDPSKLGDLKELGTIPRRLDARADDAEIQRFIEDIVSTIGPIDILVSNAGYILEGAVKECSNEEIEDQFNVNVFSQIRLLRAVLPSMRARRSGVIAIPWQHRRLGRHTGRRDVLRVESSSGHLHGIAALGNGPIQHRRRVYRARVFPHLVPHCRA